MKAIKYMNDVKHRENSKFLCEITFGEFSVTWTVNFDNFFRAEIWLMQVSPFKNGTKSPKIKI